MLRRALRKDPARRFRELLAGPGIIRSVGAHDVLTAVLLERAGFESVFIGGFGTSASLCGLPDLSFLGMCEMADAVRRMAHRVAIPVIADADTGHGDLLILEDQVFPKRCGHFEGKQVIPREEMVLKIKAATRARTSPEFVLIARTDAREPSSLDEAIERVNEFCAAGADIAFIEAPLSVDELESVARRVTHPKLANMLPGGKTPILTAVELEAMGFKIVVAPIESVLLAAKAVQELAEVFLRDGDTRSLVPKMLNFSQIKHILGVEEYLSLRDNLSRE
jgi:2-methylisocitrate lyase-like PEP mutase family enzyme